MPLNDLAIRLGFATAPPPTKKAAEVAAALPVGTCVYAEGPDESTLFALHARLTQKGRDEVLTLISAVHLHADGGP